MLPGATWCFIEENRIKILELKKISERSVKTSKLRTPWEWAKNANTLAQLGPLESESLGGAAIWIGKPGWLSH